MGKVQLLNNGPAPSSPGIGPEISGKGKRFAKSSGVERGEKEGRERSERGSRKERKRMAEELDYQDSGKKS